MVAVAVLTDWPRPMPWWLATQMVLQVPTTAVVRVEVNPMEVWWIGEEAIFQMTMEVCIPVPTGNQDVPQ